MFGRKQKAPIPQPQAPAPPQATPRLTDEDRAILEAVAEEIAGWLEDVNGPTLADAEEVYVCTMPAPAIEIVYPDFIVTMRLEIEHISEEDR